MLDKVMGLIWNVNDEVQQWANDHFLSLKEVVSELSVIFRPAAEAAVLF